MNEKIMYFSSTHHSTKGSAMLESTCRAAGRQWHTKTTAHGL